MTTVECHRVSLLKQRPDIKLFAPRVIVAGRSFSVRIVLDCGAEVPVDGVEVELLGTGVWYSSSQYGQQRNDLPFSRWVARPVRERRELSAGSHELSVSFELPPDAPASYRGRALSVEWSIRVHVDIPWWPDARATFTVHVSSPPSSEASAPPRRVFASSSEGPQSSKPYVEVSLGSTAVVSGGRLEGRVALSNTERNQYRALRLALVAVETMPGLLSTWTQHNTVGRWVVPLSEPAEDAPIDFALALPSGLVPGFATRKLGVEWFLEVRVDVAWSLDTKLWIPIVVSGNRSEATGETAAPLAVGSQRLALVWSEAGRQAGYNYAQGELTREIGGCRLVIRREHQGRRGLRLVGEAMFRDVDLGLRAQSGGLHCRDEAQDEVLAEETRGVTERCPVQDADDERIVCTSDDAGTRIAPVAALAEGLTAIVQAFEDARARLPPPRDMAAMVPAFRSAARRLGGDLDVASMDVRGVRDEMPFSLETQWDDDGTLARTVLEVCPTLPIDARWHQAWDGSTPPGPVPPGLEALLGDADALAVDAERIRLIFAPCRAPEQLDPHVARVEGLLGVARRLSGHGPGYR